MEFLLMLIARELSIILQTQRHACEKLPGFCGSMVIFIDTEACLRLPGSAVMDALISIYYKNIFLRLWPLMKYFGKVLLALGGGLKGRGREGIYSIGNVNELVRMYDGEKNPIGKAYSKQEFLNMLSPYFLVEELFFHFFPARSLPFRIPGILHRFLDKKAGFLIFAKCRKRP